MLHDIQDDSDDYEHHVKALFDIYCPVSTIQAFATIFCPPGTSKPNSTKVRMASNKWFGLDENSRDIWDRLDDKAKSIILGYTTPDSSRRTAPPKAVAGKPPFKPSFNRQANLHDISAYDFLLADMHDVLPSDDTPDKEETVDFEE
jgi:hypothetical protein